ncbi:hypothetical protein EJB05_10401 [Eragrostis curvula]|uniref:CASP-like protein n=1 Tax=Eragrostis curvula TaxID=38414 RepID=A0A5J9VMU5_9POAL|nr:hypothetical protein EJB05_10401 [Eragrostis curvula]
MAMTVASPGKGGVYVAKPPPPPPPLPGVQKTYDSYNGQVGASAAARRRRRTAETGEELQEGEALEGIVLVLRAGAAMVAFVGVALVASCHHGDWMEFTRYPEFRYLLGASVAACVYSAAQALRSFRRMRRGSTSPAFLDFAGDQVVAYLLITASAAALPITIRMRSAVINIFTDAMTAAISLGFIAFAALAFSAIISGFRLSAHAY